MANTKDFSDLFKQTGTRKRLLVTFPNISVTLRDEDIVAESMEISESLCSEPELRFGSCEASVFKLRIIGNVIPLIGEICTVSMYVGDIAEPFALGTYKVASDKPTADRRFRDIVAYDAMYHIINANVERWYNTILPNANSTTTLGAFRASFVANFGLEQEEITLPNDDMVVTKTIETEELSGKDVLSAICELNGCFGHIGRNGKMQYITLQEIVGGAYPVDEISAEHYISCKYEDYTTKHIGKLQIRQEENDIGCIVGEGENSYIIENNFLVYGKNTAELEAVAQKVFDIISVVSYRPASAKAIGNPCLEVGAGIRMVTQHETVETYILERTLKGIQALLDSYEADGAEMYSDNVNAVQRSILQLKGKTNKLIRTVDELSSTIDDEENGLRSQITQTADKIELKVSKDSVISEINQSKEKIQIKADKIDLQGLVTVEDLEEEGATKINGANIETGTISSDAISTDFFTTASEKAGWTICKHPNSDEAAYIYGNNGTDNNVVLKTGGAVAFACGFTGDYEIGENTAEAGATVQIYHDGQVRCNTIRPVKSEDTLDATVTTLTVSSTNASEEGYYLSGCLVGVGENGFGEQLESILPNVTHVTKKGNDYFLNTSSNYPMIAGEYDNADDLFYANLNTANWGEHERYKDIIFSECPYVFLMNYINQQWIFMFCKTNVGCYDNPNETWGPYDLDIEYRVKVDVATSNVIEVGGSGVHSMMASELAMIAGSNFDYSGVFPELDSYPMNNMAYPLSPSAFLCYDYMLKVEDGIATVLESSLENKNIWINDDIFTSYPQESASVGAINLSNATWNVLELPTIHNLKEGGSYAKFKNKSGVLGSIGVGIDNQPCFVSVSPVASYTLYHKGNVPSGSYIGNGSATERSIAIGGLSKCLLVYSKSNSSVSAIVYPTGALIFSGGNVIQTQEAYFDVNLKLNTVNPALNAIGIAYTYYSL